MSSELKTNKISPATGTAFTLGDSGDTFTVPSGGTLAVASGATIANSGTATGFGGDNTPSFAATMSSAQSISSSTWTILQFDTETWDTDSAFDSTTNYRFTVPTGEGGKYLVLYGARMNSLPSGYQIYGAIYVNGSYTDITDTGNIESDGHGDNPRYTCSVVLDLSAGDYIDHRFVQNSGSSKSIMNARCYFQAFKLNGV